MKADELGLKASPAHRRAAGAPSPTPDAGTLSIGLSVYLDLVRFVAAMFVFLEHARLSGLVQSVPGLDRLAGEAVAIFFVLSGYIIASTTRTDRGWRTFVIARAARIYSVVIPALLLGVIIKGAYSFSQGGADGLLAFMDAEVTPLKIAAILTFTGQLWTLSIGIPWNGPIWSLNYEVFYYLLFAVLTFMTGRRRIVAAGVLCVIAGPKILVLLPCWWVGVFLARRADLAFRSRNVAWFMLFAAPLAIWLLNRSGLPDFVKRDMLYQLPGYWRLEDATNFAAYYVDAVFIAVAFIAARQLNFGPQSMLMRAAPLIQWLAGYTFSLYLFHRSFQNLLAELYAGNRADLPSPVIALATVLVAIVILGSFTEKRKDVWRRIFTALLGNRASHLAKASLPEK